MKKAYLLTILFAVLIGAFLLAGCGDPYTEDEMQKKIKEKYGLRRIEVTADTLPEDCPYNDIWTIKVLDDKPFTFKVVQDSSYDLFSTNYYLWDDLNDVITARNAEEYSQFSNLYLEKELDEYGLTNATICGDFSNLAELEALFAETEVFLEYAKEHIYPIENNFEFRAQSFLRNQLADDVEDAGDTRFSVMELDADTKEEARNHYLSLGLSYNIPDILVEFSQTEIEAYIKESRDCIGVCYGDPEKDPFVYYPDLSGVTYGYGLSFGTLYEVLKREDFVVEGDWTHYTFYGADGSLYEISYDFCDMEYEGYNDGDISLGYYYLKNGEPQKMSFFWYKYFGKSDLKEMTGLEFYFGAWDTQLYQNYYTEDGTRKKLETIYLDGEEMTYETVTNPFSQVGLTTEDYKYVFYDEEKERYLITIDYGNSSETSSYPLIIAEYVNALGGDYVIDPPKNKKQGYKQFTSHWTLYGDKYDLVMFRNEDRDKYQLNFYKNGEKQDIDFEIEEEICPYYTVDIPLDVFAEMFELSYTIDNDEGAIYFRR